MEPFETVSVNSPLYVGDVKSTPVYGLILELPAFEGEARLPPSS